MKYTLITGASSGIGLELAHVFARHQHNLILVARSTQKLEELKIEIERKYKTVAHVVGIDLSINNSADDLYKIISEKNLDVDILVNNAGFGDHGLFSETSLKRAEEMILLNTLTLTKLTHLFLPSMLKNKYGRIMNVSSIAAFQSGPLMAVYYATKAFVLSFSEGLYEELNGTGVTTTALCPGPTASGFQSVANITDINLFDKLSIPTSQEVAEYGYKSLMDQKAIAVHGFVNSLMVFSNRISPRWAVRKVVKYLQQKRLS